MLVQDRSMGVGFADGLAAKSELNFGMKRETFYEITAFAPVHNTALEYLLRNTVGHNWKRKWNALQQFAVDRGGELFIPVPAILRAFRNLPKDLADALNAGPLWCDSFHNLVTTAGLNDSLTEQFKASAYTAAWYVGLTTGSPTFAAADTMGSHSGWTESTAYSESVRQTLTLGSVASGSVDNTASKATFSIDTSATVGGSFLTTVSTKSGTTGTLYGGGAFGGGNRSLQNGDSLSIAVTLTAS